MIVYYTHEDFVDFGAYMVSKERTDRIKAAYDPKVDNWTLEERLANIYQPDVDAWLAKRNKEAASQIQG